MAAKKTAKKTTDSAPADAETTPKPAAKKAAKTAKKAVAKKAVSKKEATSEIGVTTDATKKTAAKPTLDSVARAAYLNYRRRVEQGLPGDSHGDWLEAERQFAQG